MALGALMRRATPYLLIALGGFALAVAIVYLVILPEAPPEQVATATDSTQKLLPVKEAPSMDEIMPEITGPELPPNEPPVLPVVPLSAPDLIGKDMWEAQQTLDRLQLVVVIRRDTNSFELPNTVVRQTPQPGQRLFPNDTVTITISQFPPPR